jgi:hypothetical protein
MDRPAEQQILWALLVLAATLLLFLFSFYSKNSTSSSSLPPYAQPSTLDVLRARASQKGLLRVHQVHVESLKLQNTSYGSTFRLRAVPLLTTEQIIITDYKLARIVLLGDRSRDIPESVKAKAFRVMNLVDRNISNIFT